MYSQDQQPAPHQLPPRDRVRFDDIGVSLQLLQKQLGAWAGASTIVFVGILVAIVPFYTLLISLLLRQGPRPDPTVVLLPMLWMIVATLATTVVSACGMYTMALKQLRGEALKVSDVFQGMSKAGSVLGLVALLAVLGGGIGLLISLLLTPIFGAFTSVLTYVPGMMVGVGFVFSVLLVLDQDMGPVEAMKESWNKLKSEFWVAFGYILVAQFLSSIGALACGFGMIFTMPLYMICITLLYRNFYPERFPESR